MKAGGAVALATVVLWVWAGPVRGDDRSARAAAEGGGRVCRAVTNYTSFGFCCNPADGC